MTLISWFWINIISKMTMSSTSFLRGHMPKLGMSLFFSIFYEKYCANSKKKIRYIILRLIYKTNKTNYQYIVFDKNIFCFRRCKIPCNFNFPRNFLFFHFHLLYALHATTSFKDPHLTPTPMLHVCDWMLQNLSTGTVLVHVITLLLIRVLKRIGM